MSKEMIILASAWIVTIVLLILFINKKKLLDAQFSYLSMQVPTWLLGALVVQKRLIEYPVGLLETTYKASFSFEFFIFPAVSAIFNVNFPRNKSMFIKILYTISFSGAISVGEFILEKYTELIKYINWAWYWSFIGMTICLLLNYYYYRWFFKKIRDECSG